MARSADRPEGRRPLQVMEKTLSSITGAVVGLVSQYSGFTKDFQLLVKAIGEARTKHEEERIVRHERRILQEKLKQPDIPTRHMKEFLIRLVYCEMLGHDASFGHIHALKFVQSPTLLEKRVGYLAVSLLLHKDHELIVLLINTLQKDLKSPNILEVSMALTAVTKMIGPEMIPAVLPSVASHLNHQKEIVKKKAVLALHHFHRCSPSSIVHLHQDFRHTLCDKDPGVMEASLNIFHDFAREDVSSIKDLTASFVSILKQVVERKLPREFDYHGIPAPWVQMKILRILALLGVDDLRSSECMYEVINLCMVKADPGVSIGQAIVYECIRTVTAIYPNSTMIERCAKNVGRLLSSLSNNLKYLGINALSAIVAVSPKFAMEHQLIVIECLDDPDETLKRKTLELLCRMTNPSNIEVICEKLVGYLRSTVDSYLRSDLVERITLLAEQYAPDNEWFIRVMNSVFELGGDLVRQDVAQNLMRLIAEGSDDDDADTELRLYAVSLYLNLMEKPNLPDILVQVIAWVVGEYSYLSDDVTPQEVLHKLCALLDGECQESATRGWILTATLKLVSQMGSYPIEAQDTVDTFSTSMSFDLQQRCCEMKSLASDLKLMQEVMPVDASCEDLEVDPSLSFLNGFVSDAQTRGAAAYQPVQLRTRSKQRESKEHSFALNFQPYDPPTKPFHASPAPIFPSTTSASSRPPSTGSATISDAHSDTGSDEPRTTKPTVEESVNLPSKESRISGLAGNTPRVWGKSGYLKKGQASPVVFHRDEPSTTEQEVETYSTGGMKSARPKPTGKPKKLPYRSENHVSREEAVHPASSVRLGTQNQRDLLGLDFTGLAINSEHITDSGHSKVLQTSAEAQSEQTGTNPQSSVDLLLDLQGLDLTSSVPLAPVSMTSVVSISQDSGPIVSTNIQENSREQLLLGSSEGMKDIDAGKSETVNVGFSFMTKSKSPSPPGSQTSSQMSLLDSEPASIGLPDDLKQHPCATSVNQDLCSDGGLRLCCRKVYSPTELTIVFFLTNQKSNQLLKVTTQLEMPANLEGILLNGSGGGQWEDDIEGFTTIRKIVKLKGRQPGVNMSLRGQVSYRDTTQQKLFFSLTIHIDDLLRPMSKMGTDEFGRQWSSGHWHDRKLKVITTIRKPDQLMEKIKQRLNLHPIQIIGQEGVAAGSFLQTSILCLIHSKVLVGGQVELWIKTGNNLLTDLVAKQCQTTL